MFKRGLTSCIQRLKMKIEKEEIRLTKAVNQDSVKVEKSRSPFENPRWGPRNNCYSITYLPSWSPDSILISENPNFIITNNMPYVSFRYVLSGLGHIIRIWFQKIVLCTNNNYLIE